ncbi:MAG: 3-methylcrotonyl-CoA carboxylase, partial [Vulcanimicrobiota bacterium]
AASRPSVGTLGVFQPPAGPNLRLDTGFRQGDEVSIHFDPMLAKLISYGPDREAARRGLLAGLKEFAVLGVTTNIPYLGRILSHPTFIDGEFHTQFLEASGSLFSRTEDSSKQALALALVGAFGPRTKELGSPPNGSPPAPTPWASLGEWRLN